MKRASGEPATARLEGLTAASRGSLRGVSETAAVLLVRLHEAQALDEAAGAAPALLLLDDVEHQSGDDSVLVLAFEHRVEPVPDVVGDQETHRCHGAAPLLKRCMPGQATCVPPS